MIAASSVSAIGLDPSAYQKHSLHAPERAWIEKNCYVDVWIELVHALRLDPVAMLPFTVAVDFVGDQWTFYKPPHEDLRALYGIDVQEMYVWKPLLEHACEHLAAGRLISTEADAFWLPDTQGTDYRQQHTKSTIIIGAIDLGARRLDYFHNAGYYSLQGEDFVKTFRLDATPDPLYMPLFAELVRTDRVVRAGRDESRSKSLALLRKHAAWIPADNPIARFAARFERDYPEIARGGLMHFHAWVFGTLRQLGSSCELAAAYLEWLGSDEGSGVEASVPAYRDVSASCKALILKLARAVNAGRTADFSANFAAMAQSWEIAVAPLRAMS